MKIVLVLVLVLVLENVLKIPHIFILFDCEDDDEDDIEQVAKRALFLLFKSLQKNFRLRMKRLPGFPFGSDRR